MKPILKRSKLLANAISSVEKKINIMTLKEQIENYQNLKYNKNFFINISKIYKLNLRFSIVLVTFLVIG